MGKRCVLGPANDPWIYMAQTAITWQNLTEQELADRIGLTKRYVHQVVSGTIMSDEGRAKISHALDIQPEGSDRKMVLNVCISQIAKALDLPYVPYGRSSDIASVAE